MSPLHLKILTLHTLECSSGNGGIFKIAFILPVGGVVPVFRKALLFPSRVAVQDEYGIYTYAGLYESAAELSREIANKLGKSFVIFLFQ